MNITDIKYYKELLEYTNAEVSELTGISIEIVDKYFNGEIDSPDYQILKDIEKVLRPRKGEPEKIAEAAVNYQTKKPGEYTLDDYYALPDDQRVELIDGVFFEMNAPTTIHQIIGSEIRDQLKKYIWEQKGECIPMVAPVDVQLDCDNKTMVEPDVLVVCDREKIIKRCVYGAPDFVVEILSKSTWKKDMNLKYCKYNNAGVKEYWLVDPDLKRVMVYRLEEDEFPAIYGFDQRIPVGIFEGKCEIDFQAIYEYIEFLYAESKEKMPDRIMETSAYNVKRPGEYTLDDYYALPDDQRVELIDGVFFEMNSPTTTHQIIAFQMTYQIENYIEENNGDCVPYIAPVDVQLDCDEKTMVEPDVLILCDQGKDINRCIYGAPDFVAEVLSPSTRKKDLRIKLGKYANAGVREYWMIDPDKRQIVVYWFETSEDERKSDNVTIYGFEDQIPVQIYEGKLKIDFAKISEKVERHNSVEVE